MSSISEKAKVVLEALGGKENIENMDVCITRLRIEVKDMSLVDEKAIKAQGAHWVTKMGSSALQVIWGMKANVLEEEIKKIM